MADKDWPSFWHFLFAFGVGLIVLGALHWIVSRIIRGLRRKGGTSDEIASVRRIALSGRIALIEQILFYLAAVAGRDVFGFAVGGWLVFKGISRYARWTPSERPPAAQISQFAGPPEFDAAVAHNRLQIFLIGTGMSVAAGGIAGVFYHYFLHLIPHLCRP